MTRSSEQLDGQLLQAYCRAGEHPAFETLVRRHAPLVLGVCRGILREPNDAEDAAQATFITLARKAPSLTGMDTVAGWLHRVAWHVSVRARDARESRRQRERESGAAAEPAHAASSFEQADALHEQIAHLPEKYRVPLVLHHLEGWSEQEVARMLGLKLGTLSGRLSRARRMLKDRLERRGMSALAGAVAAGMLAFADRAAASEGFIQSAAGAAGGGASAHAQALAQGTLRALSRRRAAHLLAIGGGILAMLLFLVATVLMTQSPDRANIATTGSLIGRVAGPSGGPVRGAVVRIYTGREAAQAGAPPIVVTRTLDDGSFAFDSLDPAEQRYVLCFIQRPVFMHADAGTGIVAGEETDVGTIVLKEGRY